MTWRRVRDLDTGAELTTKRTLPTYIELDEPALMSDGTPRPPTYPATTVDDDADTTTTDDNSTDEAAPQPAATSRRPRRPRRGEHTE